MPNWNFSGLSLGCTSKLFPIHRKVLGFLNAALAGLLSFSQFMIKMENWVFWKQAWTVLLNVSQLTKELRNWDFWCPPYIPSHLWCLPFIAKICAGHKVDKKTKNFAEKKWFKSFLSSQFPSISNVFVLTWVFMTNYILEMFNIFLPECWLTKNCQTIRILSKWDQ